jgi:hypothetical protein
LVISSDRLRLRFALDRGQLLLDVQKVGEKGPYSWFDVSLLRRLLTGERLASAVLDAGYAEFLNVRLAEIETIFGDPAWPATKKKLKELERMRSKEMFG